jgi:hypothetical protein
MQQSNPITPMSMDILIFYIIIIPKWTFLSIRGHSISASSVSLVIVMN